jgi:hypothetical protein
MMSFKQTSFFLIVSAFIVALFIVYFELKRDNNANNFTEKCRDDTDCALGLKCVNGECQ